MIECVNHSTFGPQCLQCQTLACLLSKHRRMNNKQKQQNYARCLSNKQTQLINIPEKKLCRCIAVLHTNSSRATCCIRCHTACKLSNLVKCQCAFVQIHTGTHTYTHLHTDRHKASKMRQGPHNSSEPKCTSIHSSSRHELHVAL